MYEAAVSARPRRWTDVEEDFLRAMWEFDRNFAAGVATQGDNQNGKGDFLTDLIALLLENASGKSLYGRGAVPGLFFGKHNLDASYPPSGQVELLIETKASGAPKTPRNPRQTNPLGRPGSADLKKRVTEAGLKTIDLKAEWARLEGKGGGPAGDLRTWLRRSRPQCVLFLAVRVVHSRDLEKTIELAHAATNLMDGVGLVAYQPDPRGSGYQRVKVPLDLELDRELSQVATALRSLEPPKMPPAGP